MEFNKVWKGEMKAAVVRAYKGSRCCIKGRWESFETLDVHECFVFQPKWANSKT
jgi:hypothetical protein